MLKIVRARYIWNNSQDQIETTKKSWPDKICEKEKCQTAIETKPVKKLTKNCNRDNGAKQQPRQNRSQATTKTKPVSNPKWDNTSIKQQLEIKLVQNHKRNETNDKPSLRYSEQPKRKYNGGGSLNTPERWQVRKKYEHNRKDDKADERIWTCDDTGEKSFKTRQTCDITVESFKTQNLFKLKEREGQVCERLTGK